MEAMIQQIPEISKNDSSCGFKETQWMKIDKSEAPNKYIEYVDEITKQDQIIAHTRYSTRQLRLQPGNKVIDVGCGAGKDLSRLESMVESNGQVCGIDLSREMVECAKSRMNHLPNVTVFCANASMIPIESNYFDASRCERLLQHIPEPAEVVSEMVRITRSGGRIVITDVDWWSSTISVPRSVDRINSIIIKDVVFNQHPSIGLNLRGLMSKNTNIEEIEIFAQCMYTDSLTVADDLLWLGERGKMAVQQGLITEEEYNQWRETIEEMEENGSFVFTINIFTVSGTINKKQ
ncbi:hypothetical protein PPL_11855 [Heterostelium album PN500]|uniref:Methyltransferase type 11 domain-containing protein n=1 Tax=Heterostelium pallidum (strain ATCC 26659 / Pp 5 / PN500) TaxID=670386 RepID=D3BUN4_HETP5|nr:hypothetical protein PPL_11855 [Heterostelium album PN500]EFA74822.1 hypothetical protein PPL_11855 [Heterostelium album PN500]|eukprot:XP_020426956.1 hypothetical protein PPL_11855 [Heterostelium album PN500]